MSDFELLRNPRVKASTLDDERNGDTCVHIEIDGKYEHTFPASSRVSKATETTPLQELERRLDQGYYFVVDGELYDFRYSDYPGFVHTDESVGQLMDTLGLTPRKEMHGVRTRQQSRSQVMGRMWSDHQIQVPEIKDGGEFESKLMYTWSPFERNVGTQFMLLRMICDNGMMATSPVLNAKVPVINRWQEHLNIASKQIQNKVENLVCQRLNWLSQQRATVAELQLMQRHAINRLLHGEQDPQARERLQSISDVVSPERLKRYYKGSVLEDKRMAAQLPGHLTAFDAYNISTELRSHTEPVESSTTNALDRFANQMIFDRDDTSHQFGRAAQPALDSFSDPDAAFYGQMETA